MGVYTKYNKEWIDAQIGAQLRIITDIILQTIPHVTSIFLAGGFGKGEGSVEIAEEKKIKCLRDFDIVVIVDKIPDKQTQQMLYDEIYNSLELPNPENELFRFSDFVVAIYFRRKKDLIYPDIWFYDLKVASQLLYGQDVRDLIPGTKNDVPLSSGLRVLFEKVCGLLGVFPYSYPTLTSELSKEQRSLLSFECYKTFIEICTALCILANEYESKYVTRAKKLKEFYYDRFSELAQALPNLPKKVETCTSFKLRPNSAKIRENPIELWFSTRDSLGATLRLYLNRYLGITLSEWKDLSKHLKTVARHYYKPFLRPLLHAKLRVTNEILLDITSLLYQALTNFEYAYIVTRDFGRLYLHPLHKCHVAPSLKFFSAGIMILFSLNRDGTIDKELLQKAAVELRHCIPVETSTHDTLQWDALRKHFLKAYSLCRGYHFVK